MAAQQTISSLGIDLGGTKIEIIALAHNGQELQRLRCATPQGDYPATLQAIIELIQQLQQQYEIPAQLPLGIGTPGAISQKTGLMKNCNSTCLNGQALLQDLQKLLQRPVKLTNDADCFALSEAIDGNAKAFNTVFGVILGTGVGGGLVVDKSLIQGCNRIAGEWGHNPLDISDCNTLDLNPLRQCYCGRQNCIETWLSGPALERSYAEAYQEALTSKEISHALQQGEDKAEQCLQFYCRLLAKALAQVINIFDPEAIVLGGGLSNIDRIYSNTPTHLPDFVFSDQINTRLLKAKYGDSSGVRGAAWLNSHANGQGSSK